MTAVAGQCFDIGGESRHKEGEVCNHCGFGRQCHFCKETIVDHTSGIFHGLVTGKNSWRHRTCDGRLQADGPGKVFDLNETIFIRSEQGDHYARMLIEDIELIRAEVCAIVATENATEISMKLASLAAKVEGAQCIVKKAQTGVLVH